MSPPTQSKEQDRWVGVRSGGSALSIRWVHERGEMERWVERKGRWFEISNAKGFLFLPWLSGPVLKKLLPLPVPFPISPPRAPLTSHSILTAGKKVGSGL